MNEYVVSSIVITAVSVVVGIGCFVQLWNDKVSSRIANVHVVVGILHIVSAIGLGWVAAFEDTIWEAKVYTFVRDADDKLESSEVTTIPVALLAVLCGIVSGYTHLLSVAIVGKETTTKFAERGYSPVRWIDYSVSASLMIFTIGCMSNLADLLLLISISVFQAFLMTYAYDIEKKLVKTKSGIWEFAVACGFYVVGVWLPIFVAFNIAVADAPDWVYVMIWLLFGIFSSFAVVMWYFLILKRNNDNKEALYVKQELAYISLSLIAKVSLHWMLFSGAVGRAESDTTGKVLGAGGGVVAAGILFYLFSRSYVKAKGEDGQPMYIRLRFM